MINEFNNSKTVKNEGFTLYRKSNDERPIMIFSSFRSNEVIQTMEQFLSVLQGLPEAKDIVLESNGFRVTIDGRHDYYYIKRKIPKGVAD